MDKCLLELHADYLISSFGPTTAIGLSRLENAVLVIDGSIVHKPHTDPSELIGWHYDHTTGTSVKGTSVKSINFLTTLYCTGEISLPVAFVLVEKDQKFTDKKTGQTKRRATVIKGEINQDRAKGRVRHALDGQSQHCPVWAGQERWAPSKMGLLSSSGNAVPETDSFPAASGQASLYEQRGQPGPYVATLQAAFGQWQTLQPNNLRMSA